MSCHKAISSFIADNRELVQWCLFRRNCGTVAHQKYDAKKGLEYGTFVNYLIRFRKLDLLRKKMRKQEKKKKEKLIEVQVRHLDNGNRHRRTG